MRAALIIVLLTVGSAAAQSLTFSPPSISDWFCDNSSRTIAIEVTNLSASAVVVSRIDGIEMDLPGTDWLSVATKPFTLQPTQTKFIYVVLNKDGNAYSATPLSGYVYLVTDLPGPEDSLIVPFVNMTTVVCDPLEGFPIDTIGTVCTRLAVGADGEAGRSGQGGVNLDYVGSGQDCDPGANVYLNSGAPVIIQKVGTVYEFNSSLYSPSNGNSRGFIELTPSTAGPISGAGYTGYTTGTLMTTDSAIGLIRTFYAPTAADSCNFIVQQTKIFSRSGAAQSGVTVGEFADFDVPSDFGYGNKSGISLKGFVYQRGADSGAADCQTDSSRYGATMMLGHYWQSGVAPQCELNQDPWGTGVLPFDSILGRLEQVPAADGAYFWQVFGQSALMAMAGTNDYVSYISYAHNVTLGIDDTLYVLTALATVRNGNLAALEPVSDQARRWIIGHLNLGCCSRVSCCQGTRDGDIDGDGQRDISDLTSLIDNLFVNFTPLICSDEGDVNGDGNVDMGDLTAIIDCLFLYFWCEFPPCPDPCGN